MRKMRVGIALVVSAFMACFTQAANVAKIGNTEYATIDAAIGAWTNNTTLTLLADVTLTDVIKLSSTEYHVLDLGTYTMTAAKNKNAIEYVINGRTSASYALDIKADATNPGGITATGKSIVVHTKPSSGAPSKDRPITRFYGGVFNASTIVKQNGGFLGLGAGYTGSNAPYFYFYGGEFNGAIATNRSQNQFHGGTFNGNLQMSVDSSAYTLVLGGKFKYLSNVQGSNLDEKIAQGVDNYKFTIGSAKATYDRGIYVDKDGYYVITSAPITEVSVKYPAVYKKTYGGDDYFYYSAVQEYGLFYEDTAMAIAKHGEANVTVYKQEVTAAAGVTAPEGVANNTAIENFTVEVPEEVANFEIQLVEVAGEATEPTKVVFNVEPKATDGTKVSTPASAIKFRLPVPAAWTGMVKVSHEGALMGTYAIQEAEGAKYVELTSDSFSEFALEQVAPVVKIGDTPYATLADAITAAQAGEIITVVADVTLTETLTIPAGVTVTLDLNGKTVSHTDEVNKYAINNLGTLTLKDSKGNGSINARGIYNGYGNGGVNVSSAKLIVESGTYNAKGTNGGAAIFNYGIAEINGGSFTSIGGYSLNNQAGSSMTIADGVTANNGIYCSNAKVTVNGGNISGNRSGCHVVYAWNSELTINGGTFYNNNSGNATIMSAGATKCTITGGTFGIKDGRVEGNGNTFTSCLTDTANTATMVVTGGTFNGGFRVQAGTTMTIEGGSYNDCYGSKYNIHGTVTVKGGTFTDATAKTFATNNIADGYELGENGQVVAKPVVAKIGETPYETLAAALAAAVDGDTIVLQADVAEDVLFAQQSDVDVVVDGNGKTLTGTFAIHGGKAYDAANPARETLLIKNFVFQSKAYDSATKTPDAIIYTRDRSIANVYAYSHNVTIEGCTFKGVDENTRNNVAAIRLKDGGDWNWTIKNCTANDNLLHSLLQVNNIGGDKGIVVDNCTVQTKNGMNINYTVKIEVKNSTIAVDGYVLRAGVKGNNSPAESITFSNNVLSSTATEGDDAIITLRGMGAPKATISMEKNVATTGNVHIYGTTADTMINADANYWGEDKTGPDVNGSANVKVETYYKDAELTQLALANPAAKIGDTPYATLSAAFAAVTDDNQTVTILKDVTEELTGAYPRGNITTENDAKVTITLTNSDWVYCPYTFVLGANVTLKCPALFYYAGGTQINGTLIVDAYYQRYGSTKLTINEPGSMTVTSEMFYLRYTDGDANAGIYINGDKDDSTIGLKASVIYFYQGMINAKDANIQTSVYWQTNNTDNQGSANLVLNNSKMTVTGNELNVQATGNSTVTMDTSSRIVTASKFLGAATITIDATNFTGPATTLIKANMSEFTGTIEVTGNPLATYETTADGLVLDVALAGAGTATDPFVVDSVATLKFFRDSVNAGETKYNAPGVYVALGADIDMTGIDWSVNIGDDCSFTFDGIFDGKGKTIKNLTSTETAQKSDGYICTGLFGAIYGSAQIKNLTLENVDITAEYVGNNVAALVGFAYNCTGAIDNVTVKNVTINATNATGVGTIVGYDYYSPALKVTNCTVDGTSIAGAAYVGGVIGYASTKIQLNNNTVKNLTLSGTASVGGVAGIMLAGGSASGNTVDTVTLSATGAMWANSVGAIAGTMTNGSITVTGTTVTGGNVADIVGGIHANKPTTPIEKVQAKIGDTFYTTFERAADAATEGQSVTLLVPPTANEDVEITAGQLSGVKAYDAATLLGGTFKKTAEGTLHYDYAFGVSNVTYKGGDNFTLTIAIEDADSTVTRTLTGRTLLITMKVDGEVVETFTEPNPEFVAANGQVTCDVDVELPTLILGNGEGKATYFEVKVSDAVDAP